MNVGWLYCPWYVGGPVLGLLVIGLQWAGNMTLGMTGALADALEFVMRKQKNASWRVYLLVGILLGSLGFAVLCGGPSIQWNHGSFDDRFRFPFYLKAWLIGVCGICIGYGARAAGGCTSGAGLCGVPRLSKSALATTLSFVLTGVVLAQVLNHFFPVSIR